MKMFTAKEEKNLTYVLSKITDPEVTLDLEEIHGLLFALAITPERIMPSEWLFAVYDEELQFDSDQDAENCVGYILDVYNRMVRDNNKGGLVFPFNYHKLTDLEYSLIEGWTYGLFLGLSLRPHIWGMSDEYEGIDDEKIPDDIRELIDSCSIITAVALPEEREGIFQPLAGHPAKSPAELEKMLYSLLPIAVESLQQHGAKVRKENPGIEQLTKKIGRNEPCPCGSGKKYKKCCGNN